MSIINENNIFDFQDATFTKQSFPLPTNAGTVINVEDFCNLPTFPMNRAVEDRAKRIVSLLTMPIATHAEVKVLHYKGKTTDYPAFFKKNAKYTLDGHTRKHCWQTHMKGNTVSPKTKYIPVPEKVVVTEYEAHSPEEAIRLYHAIDSQDSVETKANKLTGALRGLNMLDKMANKKLRTGTFGGALNYAVPYKDKISYKVQDVKNTSDQIETVREQLINMDKMDAPGKGHFHVQATIGIAIIAGKIMDCDDRWTVAIEELRNVNLRTYDLDTPEIDPVLHGLVMGNCENVLNVHNALPYDIGIGQNPFVCLNYISHLWKRYIDMDYDGFFDAQKLSADDIHNEYMHLLIMAYEDRNG